MTQFEKLVVSAYTGVLMTEKDDFLEFANVTLGRNVTENELKDENFWAEIKKDIEVVFHNVCKHETPDLEISLEDDAIMAFYYILQSINSYSKQTARFTKLLQAYANSYSKVVSDYESEIDAI